MPDNQDLQDTFLSLAEHGSQSVARQVAFLDELPEGKMLPLDLEVLRSHLRMWLVGAKWVRQAIADTR